MKLKNDKQRPLTIVYQGKKSVIYPGQIIDGPIQLTIYGLVPFTDKINSPIIQQVIQEKNVYTKSNEIEIEKSLEYINNYNKKELPSIGICILSKNSYELIKDCIDSIEEKVNYKNTFIYVFDTGTTDESVLNYYRQKESSCKFPFQIINVGEYHFSSNYNLGLRSVKTDYYLIQNNDTKAINDYVSRLMKIAIVRKIGACGPRMLYRDGTIQHDGQLLYDHSKKGFSGPTHVNLRLPEQNVSAGIQPADGITCAGMLVRNSVYWECNGLNNIYHDIFQDVELNIRIRMNGHAIYCDRDSKIYHYDNTSRNKFWHQNIEKLKLKHLDHSYLFGRYNGELRYIDRPKKKLSIVTVVNNIEQYTNFLNDLKLQDCKFDFEIITLPNFNNEYSSCANALNIGINLSESEYVMLCHQDLRVDASWLSDVFNKIKNLSLNNINFGVLGFAGAWKYGNEEDAVIYLKNVNEKNTSDFKKVQCLDELCLIVKQDNDIRFDDYTFDHFHGYGSDICLQYMNKGYENYALNCPLTHLSDGFNNLMQENQLSVFKQVTINLYKKWINKFPTFRNMTASFNKNKINLFINEELKKRGISIESTIDPKNY